MLVGLWLTRGGDNADQRGFGQQAAAWGLIDAGIALGGWIASRRRSLSTETPVNPDGTIQTPSTGATDATFEPRHGRRHGPSETVQVKEAANLRRMLWLNAGLDVFYIIGGYYWARRPDPEQRGWAGHGWGIVVQGTFLLVFDLVHALALISPSATAAVDVKDQAS